MRIVIQGRSFTSRQQAVHFVRDMLARYAVGETLSPDDCGFVMDLIRHHARAQEKIGCGIAAFVVYLPPPWKTAKGMLLVRTNGTREDFSFMKCIYGYPSNDARFKTACRTAVIDQILQFKNSQQLPDNKFRCSITGELVIDCDVHHDQPSFLQLVNEFAREYGLDINVVPTKHTYPDDSSTVEFEDPTITRNFAQFHRQRARMQIVSKKVHRKLRSINSLHSQ